jgi:hypothetical protein
MSPAHVEAEKSIKNAVASRTRPAAVPFEKKYSCHAAKYGIPTTLMGGFARCQFASQEGRTCLMRGCNACLKGHAKDYTTVDKVVVAVAVGLSVVINPSAKTRATPFHFVAGIA